MRLCGKDCGRPTPKDSDRYCRECRNAYNREWRKANPAKRSTYHRKWRNRQTLLDRCHKCTRPICEFSTDRCLIHYLARRARKALGAETVAGAKALIAAFERQEGLCPYTGRKLTYGTAEIDHVHPRSKGGREALTADNIEWVHPDVNRAKSGMSREEFIALCRDIAVRLGPRS
ncbi:hypothetical protein GCM10010324_15520 [Streptomyces hiroshimensis]|uniref:HNH nuclease domain-containing protein n=1 Tax=Streptomyces hiroshimensis TaxID=66424 RepID=A0ABQ2Y836_9ACTN|nr:hypothetical protein GCM10010324_15520 [Streptomyces hiroshimensis]